MDEKKKTINLYDFDDEVKTMKTRHQRSVLAEKRDKRRQERELVSPSARAERLTITKAIASEIVSTQEDLGGGRHGCRMEIIRRYSQIYSWLKMDQVDYHAKQIRKQKQSNCIISKDYTNNCYNVIDSLVVNDSTLQTNEITVSFKIVRLIVGGGRAHPFWMHPDPDGIIHLGLATSPLQTSHLEWPRWHYPSGPRS